MIADIIIAALVIGYCAFLIYRRRKDGKAGGCSGCSGCGGGCASCGHTTPSGKSPAAEKRN